jgi:hypothetical protein
LQGPHQYVRGQRFRTHVELERLFCGEHSDRTAALEQPVDCELGSENGRQRYQYQRDN